MRNSFSKNIIILQWARVWHYILLGQRILLYGELCYRKVVSFLYWRFNYLLLCRNIKEPRNVKLLFDVLHYDPLDIKRAVLFATNNALVCETPEDAMKVAYEMDKNRYDVSIGVWS
jgi:hypothetical protein